MSPSANFTTYNLPPSDDGHRSSYTIPRPRGAGGSSSGRAMGAFRFLLCSRPCFQQSVDIDQEGTSFDSHQHHHLDEDHHVQSGNGDEDWKARMEMQVKTSSKFNSPMANCRFRGASVSLRLQGCSPLCHVHQEGCFRSETWFSSISTHPFFIPKKV